MERTYTHHARWDVAACIVAAILLICPDARAQRPVHLTETDITADADPWNFTVVGPSVFFRSQQFGQTDWLVTDGTVESTRIVEELEESDRFIGPIRDGFHLAMIDGRVVRLRGDDLDTATLVEDTRDLAQNPAGPLEHYFFDGNQAFVVNTVMSETDQNSTSTSLLVSRAGPAGIEQLVEIAYADDFQTRPPWHASIDAEGRLDIYSRDCRHWLVSSEGMVLESEVVDSPCANAADVELARGRIVPRWDGVFEADELEPLIRANEDEFLMAPVIHGGLAYVRVVGIRGAALWVTDGRQDGTRMLDDNLPYWRQEVLTHHANQRIDLVPAGDAMLYLAETGERAANIFAHRGGEEPEPLLPDDDFGSVKESSPVVGFVFLNDRIIYKGYHSSLDGEVLAVEFETVPFVQSDSPDGEGASSDETNDSSGCGCGTAPPADGMTTFLLLATALLLGRRRLIACTQDR